MISLCTGDASMFSTFLNDSSIVASLGGYDVDLPLDKVSHYYLLCTYTSNDLYI